MIRFLAGLAVTVATVIVVLRLIGAAESAAVIPAHSPSITVVGTCQAGERALVRALPDGSIEGVQCQ